jgi:hypothetical protein
LFDAMSGISEAAHGLRWAPGTEYGVWRLLTSPRIRWGRVRANDADVESALINIEALVLQADIWIVWPTDQPAPTVLPVDEWRVRFQANTPNLRRVIA